MKTKTLKSVLAVLGVLLSLNAFAYDVEIDGIYYNVVKKAKTAEVTNGVKYTGEVTIPASFEYDGVTYSVTSIGVYAFYNHSGLTSITIPNSVTSIGNEAFRYCSGLTSITIPNSVTSIGDKAFDFCSGLTSVTIPNSVTTIGNEAFQNCVSLTAVHITDLAAWCNISFGQSSISHLYHLYLNGEEVKDLVIPNSVTSIGASAFHCCSGLTSLTISNSVTSIGSSAFASCSGLTSVTIPNSVTSIGSSAFNRCSRLTSINIPNSVTSIDNGAFKGCI